VCHLVDFFFPVDEGKCLMIYHTATEMLQVTLITHTTILIFTWYDHVRSYEKSRDCMESFELTQQFHKKFGSLREPVLEQELKE